MDTDLILLEHFIKKNPVQAAHTIEGLENNEVADFLEEIPMELSLKLISMMNIYKVGKCLLLLKTNLAVELLEKTDIQKAELLLRQFDEKDRSNFLDRITPKRAAILRTKLEFAANSVGALMIPLDFLLRKDMVVKDAIKMIRREKERVFSLVCIVDGDGTLEGIVRLRDLLLASGTEEIAAMMNTAVPTLLAESPIEAVRNHPGWHEYRSLPVVDSSQKLIGTIKFEAIQKNLLETGQEFTKEVMETSNALGELYRIGLTAFLQSVSK